MARPPRPDVADAWHHIYNRGADRQDIFTDDPDRHRFETLFAEAATDVGAEIHASCQMTNHFHGLVHCPSAGLSTMLQRLQGRYAAWYNDRYERSGPVFGGRFGSTLVTSDAQLLETSRYIHANPIDIVPAGALAAYRWSTYGCYVGSRAVPAWLWTDAVLGAFGGDPLLYRKFVESHLPERTLPALAPPTLAAIVSAVTEVAAIEEQTLRADVRGLRNDARLMVALLAIELRSASSRHVAEVLGTTSRRCGRLPDGLGF